MEQPSPQTTIEQEEARQYTEDQEVAGIVNNAAESQEDNAELSYTGHFEKDESASAALIDA